MGTCCADCARSKSHRHLARLPDDEPRLVSPMIELATTYGRYGYRRITGLLRGEGWTVHHKRVERSGGARASKCRRHSRNEAGCGWLTGPACAVVPSIAITSGRTTSWRTARTTGAR